MNSKLPLQEVVKLGGLGLQAEDCLVRAAVQHRGKHGGLARMENERYHQFLIWRAILPVWHAVLERDESCDLTVECETEKHFFELKNWRGKYGSDQLPSMQRDIAKLNRRQNGYLIVTSINPSDQTDANLTYLLTNLHGLDADSRQDYRFLTETLDGRPIEFWIAGWQVQELPCNGNCLGQQNGGRHE